MTLTEFRYIAAVAAEKHFGRAAAACNVSQPTLSIAVRNLEDELGVKLFERTAGEISVTDIGREVVEQAERVLAETERIRELARMRTDPLAGPLRLGVIYTIGPYLLPELVRQVIERVPQMPLILNENFTVKLLDMLRAGEIDCAILAEPFNDSGLATTPLYDEPFYVAVPAKHALAAREEIQSSELENETMLLLGAGHCFRDHVLEVCPEHERFRGSADGLSRNFEGSSLETIRHMVASGMGITVLPALSVPAGSTASNALLAYIPFSAPAPQRRVVLVWRRSFTRHEAIAALRNAVLACELEAVTKLSK
jgi:LysR family transcriptional regulator, hydrogen peroxide-inducible genes activator